MSDELEAIKQRLLREVLAGRPSAPRCPYEPRGSMERLSELARACRVVVADFWAEWCGPCRLTDPVVAGIAQEYRGRVSVVKVNVDENPDAAAAFEVYSIPTILVLFRGREAERFIGYSPLLHRRLAETIDRLLASG